MIDFTSSENSVFDGKTKNGIVGLVWILALCALLCIVGTVAR